MPSFPAMTAEPRRVQILTFPGALLLDIAGPAQVFETASAVMHARGNIPTDTGIALATVDLLLAAAGLLEGRRAVTGWLYCDRLRTRYASIRVTGAGGQPVDQGSVMPTGREADT